MKPTLLEKCKLCLTEFDDIARFTICPCGNWFCRNCGGQVEKDKTKVWEEMTQDE